MRCDNCGLPIPEQPENATYDMLLCDGCYQEHEIHHHRADDDGMAQPASN